MWNAQITVIAPRKKLATSPVSGDSGKIENRRLRKPGYPTGHNAVGVPSNAYPFPWAMETARSKYHFESLVGNPLAATSRAIRGRTKANTINMRNIRVEVCRRSEGSSAKRGEIICKPLESKYTGGLSRNLSIAIDVSSVAACKKRVNSKMRFGPRLSEHCCATPLDHGGAMPERELIA